MNLKVEINMSRKFSRLQQLWWDSPDPPPFLQVLEGTGLQIQNHHTNAILQYTVRKYSSIFMPYKNTEGYNLCSEIWLVVVWEDVIRVLIMQRFISYCWMMMMYEYLYHCFPLP